MTTSTTTPTLPTVDAMRARVCAAFDAIGAHVDLGEPGGHGLQASTPVTGEVLFTTAETTPAQADAAIRPPCRTGAPVVRENFRSPTARD